MSELAIGNFTTCCRLCLSEQADYLKPLFDVKADDKTLPEKISTFVDVKVTSNDKITTMVCNQCTAIVNSWMLFKKSCRDNQSKLMRWLQMWTAQQELSDMSVHIKEEPVEHTLDQPNEIDEDNCTEEQDTNETNDKEHASKNIEMETNGEFNELPPELTPFDCDVQISVDEGSEVSTGVVPDNMCSVCSKAFSSSSNRRKHERLMHGLQRAPAIHVSKIAAAPVTHDERSQNSADSQTSTDKEVAKVNNAPPSTDTQKIEFAAGLKLFQNSTPPISQENLSKIELSYIDKCKAMVNMFKTMECACHNVLHPNLKGLLSHLRALRIWFPVFTCYNCMITFTDRSSSYRHNARCPRTQYESLIKLSNLRKRSNIKTRLYQNYKCNSCKYMFFFHEDFCKHISEEHTPEEMPCTCECGRQFNDVDEYKEHSYLSCSVSYYCDICFITTNTLEEFQKHAIESHDNSEGFVLLQEDNYRKKKPVTLEKPGNENEEFSLNNSNNSSSSNGNTSVKRKSSYGRPLIEPQHFEIDVEPPQKKPHLALPGISTKATTCPLCCKQYSSYANMMRHYKSHTEEEIKNGNIVAYDQESSYYCCPDCGGMFGAHEWDEHKMSHGSHACSECGKVFSFQAELDQHRSVHLNLKLYRDSKTSTYKSTMLSPNSENAVLVMCEVCDAIFQSKEQLKEHKRIHDVRIKKEVTTDGEEEVEEKRYECKPCNKQYSGYSGLWDHNKKKHPEIQPASSHFPKQCHECDKLLYSGGAWFMHRQMHERIAQTLAKTAANIANNDNDATGPTSPVRQSSRTRRSSTEEMNDDNDEDESYFTCKKCFKVFSTKSNLVKHMKSHGIHLVNTSAKTPTKAKIIKKVWCDVCHQSCDSAEALRKHKEQEHKVKIKTEIDPDAVLEIKNPFIFTCDVCTRTFTTKIALKKHKERHVQEDSAAVKKTVYVYCKYCKIPFATVDLLNQHMLNQHDEEIKQKALQQQQQQAKIKQFACNVCKKAFISAAALYAHQGWHKRGKVEKQIKTQEKLFRKMVNNLAKPQQQLPPQFQCSTCLVQLPNDTALQIHILEKHRNVDAVALLPKCQPCNQDFDTQEEYDYHKRLHEVVEKQQKFSKNFKCTYCPAAFSRSDTLATHIRTVHKDLVPTEFRCNQCDRTFEKQNALSVHLKVHEKQKSNAVSAKPLFSCSICNMGFDLPKELRAHTIKAHPF